MRFELTTPTLARLCSTPELRPHPFQRYVRRNDVAGGRLYAQSLTQLQDKFLPILQKFQNLPQTQFWTLLLPTIKLRKSTGV